MYIQTDVQSNSQTTRLYIPYITAWRQAYNDNSTCGIFFEFSFIYAVGAVIIPPTTGIAFTTGSVSTGSVSTGSVTSGRVTSGSVTTGLNPQQVTTGQTQTGAVTTGQTQTGQTQTGAVTTGETQTGAVTTGGVTDPCAGVVCPATPTDSSCIQPNTGVCII